MKFATKPFDIIRLTLDTLLHYLGKLKIQIFLRYSADMEEKILFLSLNTMLIVDTYYSVVCCDEFQVPQVDRRSINK